jgi:hypothetical protein
MYKVIPHFHGVWKTLPMRVSHDSWQRLTLRVEASPNFSKFGLSIELLH